MARQALPVTGSTRGNSGESHAAATTPEKLSVIGADYMQIDALAKKLHKAIRTEHDYTSLRDTKRGRSFDVVLDRGRIARVTIELDRVENECPNRPEWAMPGVSAIRPEGFCFHCSKVRGEWIECEASGIDAVFEVDVRPEATPRA